MFHILAFVRHNMSWTLSITYNLERRTTYGGGWSLATMMAISSAWSAAGKKKIGLVHARNRLVRSDIYVKYGHQNFGPQSSNYPRTERSMQSNGIALLLNLILVPDDEKRDWDSVWRLERWRSRVMNTMYVLPACRINNSNRHYAIVDTSCVRQRSLLTCMWDIKTGCFCPLF